MARDTGVQRNLARGVLLFATFCWGATFVVVQKGLEDLPVFHLITYRFALGVLLLLPLLRGKSWTPDLLRDGLLVGGVLFAGFAFQTSGLLWTTPSRSAFLTALSVLLVPPLSWLFIGQRPKAGPVAGAVTAAAGLYILYRPGIAGQPFGLGDLLTLACAVAFAGHVLLVERTVRRHSVRALVVAQFVVVMILAAPSLLLQPPTREELTANALFAVGITGVFATAVAFLCLLYAQRHLTATETAIILALEPVVAAGISVLWRVEPWTSGLALGGSLVVLAILLAQLGAGRQEAQAPGAATPRA